MLSGFSHTFVQGQATALLGPNGAGKSTLLHLCAGLLHPDQGSIQLVQAGHPARPLSAYTPAQLARLRSFLGQQLPPVFDFTVEQVIAMGAHAEEDATFWGLTKAQRARVDEAIARANIQELRGRVVGSLSGGERGRVMVARSMMSRAPWWMWDEPTSDLDPRHALQTMRWVREHCDGGGGAIVVLHDLNLVAPFFDHVVLLGPRGVVAKGQIDQAMTPQSLTTAFQTPIELVEGRVWHTVR